MTPAGPFYERVRERAHLSSAREAREASAAVVASLGRALGSRLAARLQPYLPEELGASLSGASSEPDDLVDAQLFVGPIVNTMDMEYGYDATLGGMDLVSAYADDDAATRTKAVFSAMKARMGAATREEIAAALPSPVADWWRGS